MYFSLRRVCKKNIIFVKFVKGILRKDSFFIGLHDFNLIHNIIAMLEYNELIAAKREWLNNQKMVLLLNVCTLYIIQKTCSLLNAKLSRNLYKILSLLNHFAQLVGNVYSIHVIEIVDHFCYPSQITKNTCITSMEITFN